MSKKDKLKKISFKQMKRTIRLLIIVIVICAGIIVSHNLMRYFNENKILKEVVLRLQADSRIAEILVTNIYYDEAQNKTFTTIKFLEYDAKGNSLKPRYFTLPGNIIQFQSLVIRFDDFFVKDNDPLKGKSAYLFWKVFVLDGVNTVSYDLTRVNEIPLGYKIEGLDNSFEEKLWREFWMFALDSEKAKNMGIKNAQIEAPGTMFIPGTIYTIRIEHDGGMRIDVRPLPEILKGESIPK